MALKRASCVPRCDPDGLSTFSTAFTVENRVVSGMFLSISSRCFRLVLKALIALPAPLDVNALRFAVSVGQMSAL